jgi:hypothetical protein
MTIDPTPAATPGRFGAAWRAVLAAPGASASAARSVSVAAGGPGWIALVAVTAGDAVEAWTSADGLVWQAGPSVPVPSGYRINDVTAMTSFEGAVYGLGIGFGGPEALGEGPSAIVWRSTTGATWDAMGSGAQLWLGPCPAGCASVSSIAANGTGVVLAGYRVAEVGDRYVVKPTFWFTPDGITWTRKSVPAPAGSSDTPAAEVRVAAVGSGFVAAGTVCDTSGRTCRAVTWTSADGLTWAAPVNLPGGKGARALQIASGPAGGAAIGMRCGDAGCDLVGWGSADGVAWETANLTGAYEEGSTELAVAGGTFILVTSTDQAATTVWTSGDGGRWATEAAPGGLDPAKPIGQILGLAGRPGAALAVGIAGGSEEETLGLWVSP